MSTASRLKSIIPLTLNESGWTYDGPFSTYKEAHSAILGFAAGVTGQPEIAASVVAYAVGRGSKKSRGGGERADAHWRQIAEEPAYALGAMAVGRTLRQQGLVQGVEAVATLL